MEDPISRFQKWLERARAVDRDRLPEPTAFALGTCDASGQPAVRMLLLKGVDERGFVFYTNMHSRKGGELRDNPRCSLCFHWQPLELQVRVEGRVTGVSPAEADAYFASRPRGSQLGAWASDQSRPVPEGQSVEQRLSEVEQRFEGKPVDRPPHWSGYVARPHTIEFWEGRPNRLHVRHRYTREGDSWTVQLLFP